MYSIKPDESDTWAVKKEDEIRLERNDTRLVITAYKTLFKLLMIQRHF